MWMPSFSHRKHNLVLYLAVASWTTSNKFIKALNTILLIFHQFERATFLQTTTTFSAQEVLHMPSATAGFNKIFSFSKWLKAPSTQMWSKLLQKVLDKKKKAIECRNS